jgi:hypothetical protein
MAYDTKTLLKYVDINIPDEEWLIAFNKLKERQKFQKILEQFHRVVCQTEYGALTHGGNRIIGSILRAVCIFGDNLLAEAKEVEATSIAKDVRSR